MKIGIVTPAPPQSRYGNRVTALRWAWILRNLGHRVTISQVYEGGDYDLLIALHARRSYPSVSRFHHLHPGKPLVVALTGTDLSGDLKEGQRARKSLELATFIVVLQPKALGELPPHLHGRARVIYQSVEPFPSARNRKSSTRSFTASVIGHLRPVKDPFRAALASRLLPPSSKLRILHVGGAMSDEMAARARAEMRVNPRYRWLGEKSRWYTRRILMGSDLFVLSSRSEGGANVISEAITASVPVIASRIAGTVGILGEDYPGYFSVGGTRQLMQLLVRAEWEPAFLNMLRSRGAALMSLFKPAREQGAWADLLKAITSQSRAH
jgi:putative glycosyltransferase (TIGR04348 family)